MPGFGFFTRFAAKVLDFDHTSLPEQQFAMIQDVLANEMVEVKGKDLQELLSCLKRKHIVNSITVRRVNDGIVFSSNGNGQAESMNASQIVAFVNKTFSSADIVTMRTEKEWVMLMPFNGSIFVVKANSALSGIELRALARETNALLKKRAVA
jgi:hypothetical protein